MLQGQLPQQQRAAVKVIQDPSKIVDIKTIGVSEPGPDQILVKITWTGVCGTDKCLLRDDWKSVGHSMQPGTLGIAGHEGVGVVVAIGDDMHGRWKLGDRAGVKYIAAICGKCSFCQEGDEVHCCSQSNSGLSVPGTFQEYCITDGKYASRIPDGITDQEAAPILCGGTTAYEGLKKSGVKEGQWIVIPGAGGGLGHMAVQYARAMGMRVIGIDTGEQKRELVNRLGAEAFIDFKTVDDPAAEIHRLTTHGAHGVLLLASSKAAFDTAPMFLRPRGTIVVVGIPTDASSIAGAPPGLLVASQLRVVGSLVGNLETVQEAFDFTVRGLVHPVVVEGRIEHLDSWISKLEAGQVAGRIVLRVTA